MSKTFIAKRSFYGDLGSVRRRQILTIDDSRLIEQLTDRGLIEAYEAPAESETSTDDPDAGSSNPNPKSKPKGRAKAAS